MVYLRKARSNLYHAAQNSGLAKASRKTIRKSVAGARLRKFALSKWAAGTRLGDKDLSTIAFLCAQSEGTGLEDLGV